MRRAAQRAFIISERRLRAAGLIRPRRRALPVDFLDELALFEAPPPWPERWRAQRARAAAAILARASGDILRRPPLFAALVPLLDEEEDDVEEEDDELPPKSLLNRSSSAEICRRMFTACSSDAKDRSIVGVA